MNRRDEIEEFKREIERLQAEHEMRQAFRVCPEERRPSPEAFGERMAAIARQVISPTEQQPKEVRHV